MRKLPVLGQALWRSKEKCKRKGVDLEESMPERHCGLLCHFIKRCNGNLQGVDTVEKTCHCCTKSPEVYEASR